MQILSKKLKRSKQKWVGWSKELIQHCNNPLTGEIISSNENYHVCIRDIHTFYKTKYTKLETRYLCLCLLSGGKEFTLYLNLQQMLRRLQKEVGKRHF